MVCIPKIVGFMSCGFLLCLGLSNASPAVAGDGTHERQPGGSRVGGQGSQSDPGLVVEGEKAGKPHARHKGGQRSGGQGYQPEAKGEKAATPHTRMPGGQRAGGQGGQ